MKTTSLALLALLGAGSIPVCTRAAEAPAKPAKPPDGQPAGALTKAPAVVTPAQPEYPPEAKAQGLTGAVTLQIEISATGQVVDAVVTGPAGHGFDEAALAAARKLVFSPAEIDGKPAAVRIEYRYEFALTAAPAQAEEAAPVNLRGRVMEMGTRVPVVAAQIEAGGKTAFTDKDGRFALTVPLGEVKVVVSDPAHAKYAVTEEIAEGKATEVTYWILRTALGDADTIVTGKREKREVSQTTITPGEIRRIAGVNGDTVKVIQNLPGVARAPFGMGQLIVRGGNPRDTRVYVDGLPVPGVFHFGGLYSIYSSELVQEVEFQPGNFGASSGRAIGGRINVVSRDPGEKTHAVGDVNLYLGTGFWEGKVADGVGVALAARRSWADYFIRESMKKVERGPGVSVAPQFYDFQGKVAWKPTPRDTLRLDTFGSLDRMVFTSVRTGDLSNANVVKDETQFYMGQLRYEHRFSENGRLLLAAGAGWQEVVAQFGDRFLETDRVWTSVYRAELRQRLLPWLELNVGGDAQWNPNVDVAVTAGTLDVPGQISSGLENQLTPNRFHKRLSGYEAGVFAEATLRPLRWLKITPGVRADWHHSMTSLSWVDPRLAVRAELDEKTALKGGVGLYHQAPPVAYLTTEWGNPDLTYEQSWQYSLGVERKLLSHLSLDAEVYYKRLSRLALPTSDIVQRDGRDVPLHFVSEGTGKAYGAELLLRWDPDGRFFGWVAYSLSRSKRDQSSNGGRLEQEGSDYDQPHNLVAVGNVELPEIWEGLSAGFRFRYTSGNPYERVRGAVYDADSDSYQPITTGRNNRRMPDFYQLDLRIDRKKTYRLWSMTTYVEVQNVTLRKNPEFPAYNYDYKKQGWVTGMGFFPAFGVRAEY
jgi:TonB family protein